MRLLSIITLIMKHCKYRHEENRRHDKLHPQQAYQNQPRWVIMRRHFLEWVALSLILVNRDE